LNTQQSKRDVFEDVGVTIDAFYFRIVTFSSIHHLSIHFPSNYGDDNTQVYYIGLKGDFSEAQRTGISLIN